MRRGEIWLVRLDPTVGTEIRKLRPAVIVNDDDVGILPLKVIVPITDWDDRYVKLVWMTKLLPNKQNGLSKVSAADAFQVRSVSQQRFDRKIGNVNTTQMEEITDALALVLRFD